MRRRLLLLALVLFLGATGLAWPSAPAWLTVSGVRWQQRSTDLVVRGTLVSRAPRVVWDVRLGIIGYDREGYPVANGGVWFHSIGPGEERTFEAHAGTLSPVSRVEVFVRSAEDEPPARGATPWVVGALMRPER